MTVPAALLERLKVLQPWVASRPEYAWGTLDVKATARLALLRGIEALERERDKAAAKSK